MLIYLVHRITYSPGEFQDELPGVPISIVLAPGRYGWSGGPDYSKSTNA